MSFARSDEAPDCRKNLQIEISYNNLYTNESINFVFIVLIFNPYFMFTIS